MKRLSDMEVEKLFKNCNKSLVCLANQLLKRYFSAEELELRNVCVSTSGSELFNKLDPIRVDLIKTHLIECNGGSLGEKDWALCKKYICIILCKTKKRYESVINNL